jgi:hypothetical protein
MEPRLGNGVEPRRELADPIARDGDSRRGPVTPVAPQQILALAERRVEIERADRATGALAFIAVEGDEDRRSAELLDEP